MNNLKQFREKAGLSRKELADLVGMSDTAIRKIEKDEYGGPTLENARRIVMAIKINGGLKGYKGPALDVVFPWSNQE